MFARRLMHYCSEEVDAASELPAQTYVPAPSHARHHASCSASAVDAEAFSEADDDIYAELEDSLEDLEDGLDVLMILERAYQKTLRSHVRPADASSSSGSSRSPSPPDSAVESASSPASLPVPQSSLDATPAVVPLFEGSSTALVAILQHTSSRPPKSFGDATLFSPQAVPGKAAPEVSTDGAVIRIAHLGDCMGMLIRGEEIVWRTEEMWWTVSNGSYLLDKLLMFTSVSSAVYIVQHPGATRPVVLDQAARRANIHHTRPGGRHPDPRLRRVVRQPLGCRYPR